MWVFTKDGFFSAVENRKDVGTVLVRARTKDDIVRLAKALMIKRASHTPRADYPYRLVTPKMEWSAYLAGQALEIDYPNFKDAMAKTFDNERMEQLHEVWAVMATGSWYTVPDFGTKFVDPEEDVPELEAVEDGPPDLYELLRRERAYRNGGKADS